LSEKEQVQATFEATKRRGKEISDGISQKAFERARQMLAEAEENTLLQAASNIVPNTGARKRR
jgi:vacuolar-type H+-ATPase subunit H